VYAKERGEMMHENRKITRRFHKKRKTRAFENSHVLLGAKVD